jgi:hypothetical protein
MDWDFSNTIPVALWVGANGMALGIPLSTLYGGRMGGGRDGRDMQCNIVMASKSTYG